MKGGELDRGEGRMMGEDEERRKGVEREEKENRQARRAMRGKRKGEKIENWKRQR